MKRKHSAYPRLSSLLKRAHLHTILIAVSLVGVSLTTAGLITMRAVAEHNLQVLARALSYTVEAAVVFNDGQAAREALELIASREALDSALILNQQGQPLAHWKNPNSPLPGSIEHRINNFVQPKPVELPIKHDKTTVGQLILTSNGTALSSFLFKGFLLMVISLATAAMLSLYLTNRITRRISKPLYNMMKVTKRVRHDRDFAVRVPNARIAELNHLSEDFNALFAELQIWQQLQEQEKAALNHQASHDSLTGLANRLQFEAALIRTQLAALKHKTLFAVLYIDADHFKQINDSFGHDVGDAVLQEVAKRLRQQVRAGDTVARLGGDEFAILLPNLKHTQDVARIADGITQSMQQPIKLKGRELPLSLSIGIAVFPEDANHSKDLLKAADQAMYLSKNAGRGHWQRISSASSQHQVSGEYS